MNSLDDLVSVVNQSAVVNKTQLVGSQSGEVVFPTYDWADYLGQHFDKIPWDNAWIPSTEELPHTKSDSKRSVNG